MDYLEDEPKQDTATPGKEDFPDASSKPVASSKGKAKSGQKKDKAEAASVPEAGEVKEAKQPAQEPPEKGKPKESEKKLAEAPKESAEKAKPDQKKKDKGAPAAAKPPAGYVPRLLKAYRQTVLPALMKRFKYRNAMMTPRLDKIVLNVGVGEASQNPKLLDAASQEITAITGQKPAITQARKSISNFKLRKGMPIGCRVTLRGWRMWEFLDRLLNVAIPRIRDFRGLSDRSFDGRGNYTIGIKEQIIFPEIDMDKIERVHGFDITLVTTSRTDEEAYALLDQLGVPFRRRETRSQDQAA